MNPLPNAAVCTSARRFLEDQPDASVAMVFIDPPAMLGIGESDNETAIDELMTAFHPIIDHVYRVLAPGGACVILADPQPLSAFDLVASWAGLWLSSEFIVLWNLPRRQPTAESFHSAIRWYVKPGLRRSSPTRQVHVSSNVMIATKIPIKERHNGAQRPVELMNYLITLLTEPGDVVLDPYCGSGSTLVAAEMNDRRWLGCDIDPNQVAIALRRTKRIEVEAAEMGRLLLWINGKTEEIAS